MGAKSMPVPSAPIMNPSTWVDSRFYDEMGRDGHIEKTKRYMEAVEIAASCQQTSDLSAPEDTDAFSDEDEDKHY